MVKMLSKNMELNFKIPSKEDMLSCHKRHTLSPEKYLEFIELGLAIVPNLKKLKRLRIKEAPKVPFKL